MSGMEGLPGTIAQYEESCRALRRRIAQLSDRISGRAPMGEEESPRSLEKRRYLLYTELADMENALFHLRDYLLVLSVRDKESAS